MTQQTVLITGGAGFLGINLIRYLDARGFAIISYDIDDFTYADMKDRITIVKDDIRDVPALDRAMQGVDLVVSRSRQAPSLAALLAPRLELRATQALVLFWWASFESRLQILRRFAVDRSALPGGFSVLLNGMSGRSP